MYRKLLLVLLLFALASLGNAHPVAAQAGELGGRPWWMGALSFTLSIFAFSSVAVGLVELTKGPKVFWMTQVLAGALLGFALYLTDFGSIFFWMAVFAAILIIITDVTLFIVKMVAKRVAR